MRRRGEPAKLSGAHLLATTAIPFLFPAARINGEYFMDGSVRQLAPLSAPLNLGARRIVVLAVGQFNGQHDVDHDASPSYPSFAQAAGHALSTVFLDNLAMDVERMMQVNRLLRGMPAAAAGELGHVDALVLAPSCDLGAVAMEHAHRLPAAMHTLMRALGSTRGTGANLTSYLLFDADYCRALMDLGYADTMKRRDQVAAFLAGASDPAPLLPENFG
jgi:NTE family protein